MSFTVPRDDLRTARDGARRRSSAELGIDDVVDRRPTMGKVSIVGAGMKSHPGVAAKVFTDARRRRASTSR